MHKRLSGFWVLLIFIVASLAYASPSTKDQFPYSSNGSNFCSSGTIWGCADLTAPNEGQSQTGSDNGKTSDSESKDSKWNSPDWEKALLVAGVSGSIYAFDRQIQEEFQKNRNSTTNQVSRYATPLGDPRYAAPVLGAIYGYSYMAHDTKLRETALLSVESLFLANAFTEGLKLATHRDRPYLGQGPYIWNGPGLSLNSDISSFPSQHAATVFSVASVVASEYGNTGYVCPLVYGIASITALSRINDNQHWASDVFLGSALGYLAGKVVVHWSSERAAGITVVPSLNNRSPAIFLMTSF